MKSNNKLLYIGIIITIMLTTLATASAQTGQETIEIISTVRAENQQTRAELTKYVDAKIEQFWTRVITEGQNTYSDHIAQFDHRVHALATKLQVQFIISIFIAILLAQFIAYAIKKLYLDKITQSPTKKVTRDNFVADKYGQFSPEFEEKIRKEVAQSFDKTPFLDNTKTQPEPPKVTEIEEIIAKRKAEKQAIEKAKAEEELKKRLDENKKKEEELEKEAAKVNAKIAEKEQKQAKELEKKTEKDRKKLDEINKKIAENQAKTSVPPPEKPTLEAPTPPDILNTNLD